ncbi:MAG: GHKL domain-containing protein [Myxococcales bacterium]|nr:GHKL domain-containing protein [Myxococcales bacterium]
MSFFSQLFDTSDFPARWHCGNWSAPHGWLHIISDAAIFGAYTAIPLVLAGIVLRKRDVPFPKIFWLFTAFILFCGSTHLLEATIFWLPLYRVSGLLKAITAVVSWATVIALIPTVPRALKFRSPSELQSEIDLRTAALRQAAADQERLLKKLASQNTQLDAFAYAASHDLRAPLRAISLSWQMLNEDLPELKTADQELADQIRLNITRMGDLINGLLSFSRAGRQAVTPTEIDCHDMVQEIVGREASGSRAQIELAELPTVFADQTLLPQVWTNLIDNAIKYSRQSPEPRVEIGFEKSGEEYIFHVSDNGVGFEMEFADKLFIPFQRLHSKTDYDGSGVGLALAQRIVEAHGGRIWASSDGRTGATFFFSLPISGPKEELRAAADELPAWVPGT